MEKRCYTTGESLQYLGVKRRSFEAHILPQIRHKAIRIGNCVVFERTDLDMAWDRYKINAGSGHVRSGEKGGVWSAERKTSGYIPTAITVTSSTDDTRGNAFDSAASRLLQRQRSG